MLELTVNGERRELPDGGTIRDLIAALQLAGKAVAVEVNKQLVPRRRHEETTLHHGDVVEVVTLVGGG